MINKKLHSKNSIIHSMCAFYNFTKNDINIKLFLFTLDYFDDPFTFVL